MRILLASQFPLSWIGSGSQTGALAEGLQAAGHQVQVVSVESDVRTDLPFPARQLFCGVDGDLPFPVPVFSPAVPGHPTFDELTEQQVAEYRNGLRRLLDEQVDTFNPHIIHGQHAFLMGELILETGAPYVLTGHRAEVRGIAGALRALAAQAAENAGRLIVGTHWLANAMRESFELEDRTVVIPQPVVAHAPNDTPSSVVPSARANLRRVLCFTDGASPAEASAMLNAAARYENSEPPVETVLLGHRQWTVELTLQSNVLGLKHVTFREVQSQEAALEDLATAAVAVLASSDADFCEAMAILCLSQGVPVLAPDAEGIAEIIDSEVGEVLMVEDHELLADAIMRAMEEGWRATKGSHATSRSRHRHSVQQVIPTTLQLYEQVLLERLGHLPTN